METLKEYKHDLTRIQIIFKAQKQSNTSILGQGRPKHLDLSKYLVSSKQASNTHDGARFAAFRYQPPSTSRPSAAMSTSPTDSLAMTPRYEGECVAGVSVGQSDLWAGVGVGVGGRGLGRNKEKGGLIHGVDGYDQEVNGMASYLTPIRKVVTGYGTERQRLPPDTLSIKCQRGNKFITGTGTGYCDNSISFRNNHLSQNICDMISQLQEKNQNLKQKSLVYDSEFHELMNKYRNLKSKQEKMVSLQHAYDALMKKFEASEETRKKQELEIFSKERQAKRMMIDRS